MRIASPRNTAIATSFNPCPDPFAPLSSVFRSLLRLSVRLPAPFRSFSRFFTAFRIFAKFFAAGRSAKGQIEGSMPLHTKKRKERLRFFVCSVFAAAPSARQRRCGCTVQKTRMPPARNGQDRPPLYPHPRLDGAISNGSAALRFIGRAGALTFRKDLYCSKRSPNTNVNRATVSTIPMTIK